MNPDYADLFKIFNDHHVRYLVVGAYAVVFYAEPRYTKDLDLWVEPTAENADRVWKALTEFGAPLDGVSLEDFSNSELIYQIGVEPNRIDIMMGVPGLEFEEAWKRRVTSSYDGKEIFIVALDDLIEAKKTTNRESDRLDLKLLEQAKKGATEK
jgi:Nucleotidyl transferase of unknown function (DUF2204)